MESYPRTDSRLGECLPLLRFLSLQLLVFTLPLPFFSPSPNSFIPPFPPSLPPSFSLGEVLEFAEDMEIDIPKFWDYMAQILSHPVSDPSLIPLSLITSLMPASLVEKGKVGVLATKVLHTYICIYASYSTLHS